MFIHGGHHLAAMKGCRAVSTVPHGFGREERLLRWSAFTTFRPGIYSQPGLRTRHANFVSGMENIKIEDLGPLQVTGQHYRMSAVDKGS